MNDTVKCGSYMKTEIGKKIEGTFLLETEIGYQNLVFEIN